ncbi:restriction endonuclease subunit S [Flavobacteriales bacterium]|nr:restriction endonuclease subunit S [Flavobacteriales bacterium]
MNPKQIVEVGDILITRAVPINRTGIACKVEHLQFNLILSDKTIRLKYIKDSLFPDYIVLTLNSVSTRKLLLGKMIGMASSQVNISQANIKGICFPFPPKKEQKAIVQKVNALMGLCDSLEQEVQQSQEHSAQLMQSCLREVFN